MHTTLAPLPPLLGVQSRQGLRDQPRSPGLKPSSPALPWSCRCQHCKQTGSPQRGSGARGAQAAGATRPPSSLALGAST